MVWLKLSFNDGYLTDCGGTIEQGNFWLTEALQEVWRYGEETITFGKVDVKVNFNPTLEEDKTNLKATKEITGFDAKTQNAHLYNYSNSTG